MKQVFQLLCAAAALFLVVKLDLVGAAWERDLSARLAPGNEVVMYSLTTCGYCKATRARLTKAGIPFTEYLLDTDQARIQELSGLLQANNIPRGGVGTPTLTVNGILLVNNPGMDAIKQHLKYKG